MQVRFEKAGKHKSRIQSAAMTLVEVLFSIVILAMIMGGIIMGYVQANRMAEFSSMSLAAQSTASQGAEQAIAAKWDTQLGTTNTGPGTGDVTPPGVYINGLGTNQNLGSNYYSLDIPVSGAAILVTNIITITQITNATYPSVKYRQIQSDAIWTFPLTGVTYTNTVVTMRAPDQ
jgi:type II secretory pathway pseudopilin PulG